MEKIFLLSVIFIILLTPLQSKEKLHLKVGCYENPPKIFKEKTGNISGFWGELTNHIANLENWEIEWIYGSWDECLLRLKNNEIDIMPDVGVTPERKKLFLFNNETVLMSWVRLYKNKSVKIEDLGDLKDKKIAALKSSFDLNGPEGLFNTLKGYEIKANIIEMDSYKQIFETLQKGKIDAGVVDADFGNINQNKYNRIEKTAILFQPAKMQYAFPKNSSKSSILISKIDKNLKILKNDKDSFYYKMMDKFLMEKKEIKVYSKKLKALIISIFALAFLLTIFNFILKYQVNQKTDLLKKEIEKQQISEQKIKHLNNILYTIRDINQLITRETNTEKLLNTVCKIMIKYKGYSKIWIALFDNSLKLTSFNNEGLGDGADKLLEILKNYEMLTFLFNKLSTEKVLVIKDMDKIRNNCSIINFIHDKLLMVIKLDITENLIGIISVAIPDSALFTDEEEELFKEVSHDIEFALKKIEERKKSKLTENKLKETQQNYKLLAQTIPDIVLILDLEGKILYANPKGKILSGLKEKEIINKNIREFLPKTDLKMIEANFEKRKAGLTDTLVYETTYIKRNGEKIPLEITSTPIMENNKIQKLLIIAHDITNRKKQMEIIKKNLSEKEILLRELYHRTKNNMQIISSMISIQSRKFKDREIRNSFKEIINKINAMALVHQRLYETNDLSKINLKNYILDILNLLKNSYFVNIEKISTKLELEDVLIHMDNALNIGLVLNELFTNIFKYAFPNETKGMVYVSLHKDIDNTIHLVIRDNGVGLPPDTNLRESKSMGLQTIFSLVEYKMNGEISYSIDNGIRWDIKFKAT